MNSRYQNYTTKRPEWLDLEACSMTDAGHNQKPFISISPSCAVYGLRTTSLGPEGSTKFSPCSWLSLSVAGTSRSAI